MKAFHDPLSEKLYMEMPDTSSTSNKVMLQIDQFDIGQSYVIAKVKNRYGDIVKVNIEGGEAWHRASGNSLQDQRKAAAGCLPDDYDK